MKPPKIIALNLHVGQHITGNVRTSVNAVKHEVVMSLSEIGVVVIGKDTHKLIPYSNVQGIDFELLTAEEFAQIENA